VTSLRLKTSFTVPLEAETITPDAFAGRSAADIERLPVAQGNAQACLGDFFSVDGDGGEAIRLEGDLSRVKWIGRGMTRGRIDIVGDAGMHVGAEMRGGALTVAGNAGDWAGAEMRGGLLRIEGNAGHLVGAAYRGSERGMRDGTIIVAGNAGNEVGCAMRRGQIAIGGDVGDFAGVMLLAGTIVLGGAIGIRTGAGMKRGSIVICHESAEPRLLPTFRLDCAYRPVWLRMYLRRLAEIGLKVPPASVDAMYRRYSGDFIESGKGEILVWTSA
jgi:formylmethanofuran dehydrogenase subunit C